MSEILEKLKQVPFIKVEAYIEYTEAELPSGIDVVALQDATSKVVSALKKYIKAPSSKKDVLLDRIKNNKKGIDFLSADFYTGDVEEKASVLADALTELLPEKADPLEDLITEEVSITFEDTTAQETTDVMSEEKMTFARRLFLAKEADRDLVRSRR